MLESGFARDEPVSNPTLKNSTDTAIPVLDLKRQYATIRAEVEEAIARVCESQQLILGEEAAALEREISAYLGVSETIACASGTDALWLAMQAAGIGPGDYVVTTPFSFFASASTIVRCGARPVFIDINPATLNLDADKVAHYLEHAPVRTRAILPVHLYGQCVRMDRFTEIAAEHKLQLFEDAAQAFGSTWRGKRAGSLSLAAGFSFYPTKNLGAMGDAGLATTSDEHIAARLRSLRSHGMTRRYYHDEMGWNARMDAIQAAVLAVKLRHLADWNQQRRQKAARYNELFRAAGLVSASSTAEGIMLPWTDSRAEHVFHQYVVRVPRRDALREHLAQSGIGSEIYYPVPLHLQDALADLGYRPGDFPQAEAAAREVLALPIYPELRDDEQRTVVEAIRAFYS